MRIFRIPAVETALVDNWKRNRRRIFWLSVVFLAAFGVSMFVAGQISVLRDLDISRFYILIFAPGECAGLFFRELFSLLLFLGILALFSLHPALIPAIYVFVAFRGFAAAVFVWQLFAEGVFAGIAGLFFLLPFVLLNDFLLILFGAYMICCALYFRRSRCLDWRTLGWGIAVYACLLALSLVLEVLLFLLVLRPFFGILV